MKVEAVSQVGLGSGHCWSPQTGDHLLNISAKPSWDFLLPGKTFSEIPVFWPTIWCLFGAFGVTWDDLSIQSLWSHLSAACAGPNCTHTRWISVLQMRSSQGAARPCWCQILPSRSQLPTFIGGCPAHLALLLWSLARWCCSGLGGDVSPAVWEVMSAQPCRALHPSVLPAVPGPCSPRGRTTPAPPSLPLLNSPASPSPQAPAFGGF